MKKLISILVLATLTTIFTGCASTAPQTTDQTVTQPITDTSVTPFTLVSGHPPYADQAPIVYKGRVELKGWIENVPAYVEGTETDHFRVAEESVKDLPNDLFQKGNRYYQLTSADAATMTELKTYSKDKPATIIVDELKVVQEGTPFLNFVKIVK